MTSSERRPHPDRRFEAVLRAATEYSIIGCDSDGTINLFNEGASRMLGYESDEMVGKQTPALIHDHAEVAARAEELGIEPGFGVFVAAARRGEAETREWTYVCKDGSRLRVLLTVTLVTDDEGRPAGFVGIARDVTRENQTVHELSRAAERFFCVVEAMPVPTFITDVATGLIRYANPACETVLGYEPEEMVGRSTLDFGAWTSRMEHQAMLDDVAAKGGARGISTTLRAADGSTREVEVSASAIEFEGGPALVTVYHDVTEPRRAQRRVAELAAQARSILEAAGEGIFGLDRDGVITLVNPVGAAISGYAPDQLIGRNFHDTVHDRKADGSPYLREECPIVATLADGAPRRVEGEVLWRRDGRSVPVEYHASPILREGSLVGAVVTCADVSDRVLAQQQLREAKEIADAASRAKSEFLSHMSHELRTPLSSILGFAQLLEMRDLPLEVAQEVRPIRRAGEHLLELISQVLDIARIEAGHLPLSIEPVALAAAIHEAVRLMAPLADERGIAVTADAPGDVFVAADGQRLRQLLLNLLSNAVKYNRPEGVVTVTARTVDGSADIAVRDTGVGIPPERMSRLFVPFERLEDDWRATEGAGLGLPLSVGLAEAMSGSISVESVVGAGTTFTVRLPVAEEVRVTAEVESPPAMPSPSASHGPATVLYIEDNLVNLRLVESVVAMRPGIELLSAMQGRLGIELARQHIPDLVLLDLHLPDVNGEEVVRNLRLDPRTGHCPIVVMSADATAGRVRRLREAGVTDYLTKPIDVAKLLDLLDAVRRHDAASVEAKRG